MHEIVNYYELTKAITERNLPDGVDDSILEEMPLLTVRCCNSQGTRYSDASLLTMHDIDPLFLVPVIANGSEIYGGDRHTISNGQVDIAFWEYLRLEKPELHETFIRYIQEGYKDNRDMKKNTLFKEGTRTRKPIDWTNADIDEILNLSLAERVELSGGDRVTLKQLGNEHYPTIRDFDFYDRNISVRQRIAVAKNAVIDNLVNAERIKQLSYADKDIMEMVKIHPNYQGAEVLEHGYTGC